MTFWKTLRWIGTLCFVMIVLISWLSASNHDETNEGIFEQRDRPAPIIVR